MLHTALRVHRQVGTEGQFLTVKVFGVTGCSKRQNKTKKLGGLIKAGKKTQFIESVSSHGPPICYTPKP